MATTTRLSGSERRQRILEAATESFARLGYHGASVGEIAAAAGITKPVLYDHFASKHILYVELMERARDELTGRGAAAMAAEAPAEQRVRAAVDAFFSFVEERPATARVLLSIPRGEPELVEAARLVQAEATARIAELLAAEPALFAGRRDRRRHIELLAEFLKVGMHGLAEWWAEHPGVPRRSLVEATMDVAWSGLGSGLSSGDRRR
jgi:AcrR family transcriptional regulator